MALSRQTAKKIIDVVAADHTCQRIIRIEPDKNFLLPLFPSILRFTNLAGSFRNASMMLQLKYTGDKEFDEKICIGIRIITVAAIIKALGRLPEIHTAGQVHRVNWGNHHEATWIKMKDNTEYVFDWHATLTIHDPLISRVENWVKGDIAVHFLIFRGFS